MYAPGPRELQTQGIEAESFEALAEIGVENLRKQGECGVVCGPLSTGGTNHQMHNFEIFNAAIRGLKREGQNIFDQTPYEFGLRRLAFKWEEEGNKGYCMPILDVFYRKLFESGHIKRGWFIPGWQSSFGAKYEREKLAAHGAAITDLTHEEIQRYMMWQHGPEHAGMVLALLVR